MNNPVNNIDPTGHFVITTAMIWTAIGIGAAIGAAFGLGAAITSKTSLIVGAKIVGGVAAGGSKISGLAALVIGAGSAFVTGGLGYTSRTLISDSETFELSDIFIEDGANFQDFI